MPPTHPPDDVAVEGLVRQHLKRVVRAPLGGACPLLLPPLGPRFENRPRKVAAPQQDDHKDARPRTQVLQLRQQLRGVCGSVCMCVCVCVCACAFMYMSLCAQRPQQSLRPHAQMLQP